MNLCGFDLETPQENPAWGLQPWRVSEGATVKSVAIWFDEDDFVTQRLPNKIWFKSFLQHAAKHKYILVGWNLVFDLSWLHAMGLTKEVNACTWMDAMLLLKRVDGWRNKELGGKGYGLKDQVARRWPKYADYGLGEDLLKVPETEEEWQRLLEYNLLDSKFTCLLAQEYLEKLTPKEQRAARQEALGLSPIALSSIQGICINEEALKALDTDIAVRRATAQGILDVDPEIIESPAKLGKLLFEDWGLEPVTKTPKGKPSTDKEALLSLELEHPDDKRLKSLMNLRKVNTQQSKFVDAVYKSIAYNGVPITHPVPAIAGTYTGRMTYSSKQGSGKSEVQTGIALHQWEREKATRAILEAPEGFLLAEFDASGQEMRLMADASQDPMMLDIFTQGIDGHAYMGAKIESVDWNWVHDAQDIDKKAKEIRNLGKFANLSLQYRIGVDTIRVRALTQYNLALTYSRAESIKSTYIKTYAGVPKYWKAAIKLAAEKGYAETRGGRRIVLNNLNKYEQQQTAINFPIQGTGGDMKELAIAVLRTEFNDDVYYGWDLHDALFLYVRDDDRALETVKRIRNKLGNLPYQMAWGWTPLVALPWDAKIGKSWGTLKGVEK